VLGKHFAHDVHGGRSQGGIGGAMLGEGDQAFRDIQGLPLRAIPAELDDRKRARSAYPQRFQVTA
jgi:hypothetical protein